MKAFHALIDFIRNPFVTLLTVPAIIAFFIGLIPVAAVPFEREFLEGSLSPYVLHFDVASARTMLSVVAGGAMTALSLAYSLVLVVFTLAAGNIGPRLLKRFTSEPVNQVTAGILGGTFLYALTTLLFIEPDFMPKLTISGACFLAVISVMQLIYFVRHVSQSVSVDEEIAEIARQVTHLLEKKKEYLDQQVRHEDPSIFKHEIIAEQSGYIRWIDEKALIELAKKNGIVLGFAGAKDAYVTAGEKQFFSTHKIDEELLEKIKKKITIASARSETQSIEFSINLLIEIALRALSPGVNDTYTALAVADSLSQSFVAIAQDNSAPVILNDDEGKPRLMVPDLDISDLVGKAFHPLRRSATRNIMMAQGIARAYTRLYVAGGDEMRDIITRHAQLLMRQVKKGDHFDEDVESVLEIFTPALRKKLVTK